MFATIYVIAGPFYDRPKPGTSRSLGNHSGVEEVGVEQIPRKKDTNFTSEWEDYLTMTVECPSSYTYPR